MYVCMTKLPLQHDSMMIIAANGFILLRKVLIAVSGKQSVQHTLCNKLHRKFILLQYIHDEPSGFIQY